MLSLARIGSDQAAGGTAADFGGLRASGKQEKRLSEAVRRLIDVNKGQIKTEDWPTI
jgi:hypothetical protein